MAREWRKLMYYLPRALLLLALYFVPGIGQTVAPVLWFLFSAWMLAIQYCDYPFDNHKVSFADMRRALRQHKTDNLQFGALVSLFTMIPILNLVILPVAVCGATAMWSIAIARNSSDNRRFLPPTARKFSTGRAFRALIIVLKTYFLITYRYTNSLLPCRYC